MNDLKIKYYDEEIDIFNEVLMVSKTTFTATLSRIPSNRKILISHGYTSLTEVDAEPNINEFKVDRNTGEILFNSAMAGEKLIVDYHAIGKFCVSADNVSTNVDSNGNVIETLEGYLQKNKEIIDSVNTIGDGATVFNQLEAHIESAKNLMGNVIEGGNVNDKLVKTINNSKKADTNLNESINSANTKITEMNEWVDQYGDIVNLDNRVDGVEAHIPKINEQLEAKANKSDTSNLQGQINVLVVNGTGNSNPEVIQARVNSLGIEFGTLTERNLLIENSLNGDDFPVTWNNWEEGGINTNTGIDTPVVGYLRTVGYLNFNGLSKITFNLTNCKVYVLEYSKADKSFIKATTQTSSFNITNVLNYFRIVIAPLTSAELIPTNFLNMVGTYSFKEINQLKEKANDIPDIFNSCNKYIGGLSFKEKLKWEIGGINGALGTDVSIDYAIRSAFYTFNSKVEAISDKDMYCIAYNQDGTFNSRINKVNGVVTLTDTTKKYRFVVSNGSGNPVTDINLMLSFVTIKSKETFNENVLNIVNGSSPIFGKRLNILADSMGSVDYTLPNWWQQISNKTGAIFNNYAISGTCIGYNEERENANGKCFCNRYMEMDSSADGVIVLGGTNDYEIKLGNWNDSKNETFYGALNVLMKGLLEKYKGKPIIFMTPVQQANDYINNMIDPVTPIQSNANSSIQLQLRAEAIKRKCMQYGITCIDLYNTSGINGVDTSKIYYRPSDVTHLSLLGQSIVANNLLPILESKFKF